MDAIPDKYDLETVSNGIKDDGNIINFVFI